MKNVKQNHNKKRKEKKSFKDSEKKLEKKAFKHDSSSGRKLRMNTSANTRKPRHTHTQVS